MSLKRKVSDLRYVSVAGYMCPACGQLCCKELQASSVQSESPSRKTITAGPSACCNAEWDEVYQLVGYKRLRRSKNKRRRTTL